MVGALSIVRFRNAIKDTEQIMFLLFLIAISMALASNQYLYTIVVVVVLLSIIYLRDLKKKSTSHSKYIYLKLSQRERLNEILERLGESNNKIISIEQNNNTIDINATLNNIADSEISDLLIWLSERTDQQRVSTGYFL
jgi:cell division inhibitor SulA